MKEQESCTHDCNSCGMSCNERKQGTPDFRVSQNEMSDIKRVIGIISGKGGVGKSAVTSMLATQMRRRGYETAILDADITGPSIPKMFGLNEKASSSDLGLFPVVTKTGISVMSINLILDDANTPVVWRGPLIAGTVKQFWTDVIWGQVDYMFVDMPPGTGDVPLTVFQSLPLDGIVIVTSPQQLVGMIVSKAVNMARLMKIPVLGIIENYSFYECPDCGKRHEIFGQSHVEDIAKDYGVKVMAKLPVDPNIARLSDEGLIESYEGNYMEHAADILEEVCKLKTDI